MNLFIWVPSIHILYSTNKYGLRIFILLYKIWIHGTQMNRFIYDSDNYQYISVYDQYISHSHWNLIDSLLFFVHFSLLFKTIDTKHLSFLSMHVISNYHQLSSITKCFIEEHTFMFLWFICDLAGNLTSKNVWYCNLHIYTFPYI